MGPKEVFYSYLVLKMQDTYLLYLLICSMLKLIYFLESVSISVSFHFKSTDGRGQKMLFFLKEYVLNKWGVGLEFLNMSYTINLQIPNNRDETLPQA